MSVIQIPRTQMVDAEVFYNDRLVDALAALEKSKRRALFMPELVNARIASPNNAEIFLNWYTTPSVKVTGKNRSGEAFVVYSHVPTTLGTAKGVEAALPTLRNGAGAFDQKEFWGLLDRADGKLISSVPYDVEQRSSSGVISVDKALEHPQTIPFLGVGPEGAKNYLAKHKAVYGDNIGVWHSDDLDENTPRGRLLFLGYNYFNLNGINLLANSGRFLGVSRKVGAEGAGQKIKVPSLEQVLRVTGEYVPQRLTQELNERLGGLYK